MSLTNLLSLVLLILAIIMLIYNHKSFKYLNVILTLISISIIYNCKC